MPLNVPTDPANIAGRNSQQGVGIGTAVQPPQPFYGNPTIYNATQDQSAPPMGVRNAPQQQDQGRNMAYLAFQAFAKAHQQHQKMMSAIAQGVSNAPQQATSEPGRGERGEIIPGATSAGTNTPNGQGPQNFPGSYPFQEPLPPDANGDYGLGSGAFNTRGAYGGTPGWGSTTPGTYMGPNGITGPTGFGTGTGNYGPGAGPTAVPTYWGPSNGQSAGTGNYWTGAGVPGPGFGGASSAFGGGPPGSLYFAHPEYQG